MSSVPVTRRGGRSLPRAAALGFAAGAAAGALQGLLVTVASSLQNGSYPVGLMAKYVVVTAALFGLVGVVVGVLVGLASRHWGRPG